MLTKPKFFDFFQKIVKNNPQMFSSSITSTLLENSLEQSFLVLPGQDRLRDLNKTCFFHCTSKLSIFWAFSIESQPRRLRLYVTFPKFYLIFPNLLQSSKYYAQFMFPQQEFLIVPPSSNCVVVYERKSYLKLIIVWLLLWKRSQILEKIT